MNPTLDTQSTSIHSTIWWPRYCSPTYCTGAYNVQAMFKTHSQEKEGNTSWLIIFRLHASAVPLCNYGCNWHMASYLYCGACCPTATNLLIGAADFLGQTVDHMHTHTHRQIFTFSLTHTVKCFHRGRWCALFARLLLFLPNLNINMTHSKWWWHLHWLKMAAYLQWFFTKSDRSSVPHRQDRFLFSFFRWHLLIYPTAARHTRALQYVPVCQWKTDNCCCLGIIYR